MSRKKKPSGRDEPLFEGGRNPGDYSRPAGRRRPNRTILILCEGKQTEPNYFKAIRAEKRLPGIRVEIISGGRDLVDPLSLVSEVEKFKQIMDWDPNRDQAWCVFDLEGANMPAAFPQAVRLARRRNIHVENLPKKVGRHFRTHPQG